MGISSLNEDIKVKFDLSNSGPLYEVIYSGRSLLNKSAMESAFKNMLPLGSGFKIMCHAFDSLDTTWGAIRTDSVKNNPPEHLTVFRFTRLLAGQMDFTPGIFRVDNPQKEVERVNTTIDKQSTIYVVIYCPIRIVADLIGNYEGHPDFQFIKDMPIDRETSRILDVAIGDNIITVRKDRNSEDWFPGMLTDESPRIRSGLDFLED